MEGIAYTIITDKPGTIVITKSDDTYTYGLSVRSSEWAKGTYKYLFDALTKMKEHAIQNEVKNITLCKDGFNMPWYRVQMGIDDVFMGSGIEVSPDV
ncbi:Hypothetical protein ORPV_734 [Orpheovirus IHUMI-LCC2]|uniref:Uncharacterized protein n=1 Tax=Orpheovirus IHUMI-LCC2 TaxID=2023057 RepID=A0A2I2L519_9VIRU|nr:Hypothetical protein ORPV_734 [Orpheovirus IHUMI-LCC2]SNW62638.1 Hypothetical protein ORPV_734 [Orpheovirus IHUMI-LCC2]